MDNRCALSGDGASSEVIQKFKSRISDSDTHIGRRDGIGNCKALIGANVICVASIDRLVSK